MGGGKPSAAPGSPAPSWHSSDLPLQWTVHAGSHVRGKRTHAVTERETLRSHHTPVVGANVEALERAKHLPTSFHSHHHRSVVAP